MENTKLIIKCVEFYITRLTDDGKVCPMIEQMREIIQLDDTLKGLRAKLAEKKA